MYKLCKTEKSIERQKLFQTTLLSMMKKQKYHDITVTSLCKEMGIPRKTFYRYFDSLEDVLFMIIDDTLTNAFLFLEVKADIFGFFNYWKKHKALLDVFEKSGLSYLLTTRLHERLNKDIQDEQISMQDLRYAGYISAIMSILLIWHLAGMKQSVEDLSEQVRHMFHINN